MNREEQARIEIGHTEIPPALALVMTVAFLLLLGGVLVLQLVLTAEDDSPWQQGAGLGTELAQATGDVDWFDASLAANRVLRERIRVFEDRFDDSHPLTLASQAPVQDLLCHLGAGNEKAVLGRDGWLFYSEDLAYCTGAPFLDPWQLELDRRAGIHGDPLPAIVDFRDQLAARGIALVLLPVPVKPVVQGDRLSRWATAGLHHNASWPAFLAACAAADLAVHDCGPLLAERRDAGSGCFLATDTHWRPEAMVAVAATIAEDLRQVLGELPPEARRSWRRDQQEIAHLGDIGTMLRLPDGQQHYAPESVTIAPVLTDAGETWQARHGAPVLLLGDSFSNIFSLDSLGWGSGAGFAEQLACELGCEVDRIARNDDGAWATRSMLAEDLAQGIDRLAGTRVVVWEFACRELSRGDWRPITLPAVAEPPQAVATGPRRVTGTVLATSDRPDAKATYAEFMMTLHLDDVRDEDGAELGEILVHVLAMEDRRIKPIARVALGSGLSLQLRPWAAVKSRYERFSTGIFADEALARRLSHWYGTAASEVVESDPVATPGAPAAVATASGDVDPAVAAVLDACREAGAGEAFSVVGRDGWRFLATELHHLGAGPFWGEAAQTASTYHKPEWRDPLPVLVRTREQLAASGIELLVVPVPPRAVVYADRLPTPAPPGDDGLPIRIDRHLQEFYALLREQDVAVLDLTGRFRAARSDDDDAGPVCCATDSHWAPRGAAIAATAIVAELERRGWLPDQARAGYEVAPLPPKQVTVPRIGIIGDLQVEGDDKEELPVWEVRDPTGAIPAIDADAPLLLLSDSHGLVFSVGGDMHHEGAGLREHLAARLGWAIDHIGVKGSAIDAARIQLARRWHQDPAARSTTQVVVWCFAAREFTESGWRELPLGPPE